MWQSEDSTKFTKSSRAPSQLKPAGSSVRWRCHESSYFKSSSSFLHTLWTGSRGGGQVNFPHFLLDYMHWQTYLAQAVSASHNHLLVAIHKMWDFTSGEDASLVQFSFNVFILTYFVLCIAFYITAQSACSRQKGSGWRSSNPHSCLHRQRWQGEHIAGRCANSIKATVFIDYSAMKLWVVSLETASK